MSNYRQILNVSPPPANNTSNQEYLTASTLVIQQSQVEFGPHPQIAYCINCSKKQFTTVKHVIGNKTNIAALILCLFGLWCCCCIPYCMKNMKNTIHSCSTCGQFMGIYDK